MNKSKQTDAERIAAKLKPRHRLLLRLIASCCIPGQRYWVPRADTQFISDSLGCEGVWVSGSGDAAILRWFMNQMLTEPLGISYHTPAILRHLAAKS